MRAGLARPLFFGGGLEPSIYCAPRNAILTIPRYQNLEKTRKKTVCLLTSVPCCTRPVTKRTQKRARKERKKNEKRDAKARKKGQRERKKAQGTAGRERDAPASCRPVPRLALSGRGTRFHACPSNCESTEIPITVPARVMTSVNVTERFVDCPRESVGDCSAPAAKKAGRGTLHALP